MILLVSVRSACCRLFLRKVLQDFQEYSSDLLQSDPPGFAGLTRGGLDDKGSAVGEVGQPGQEEAPLPDYHDSPVFSFLDGLTGMADERDPRGDMTLGMGETRDTLALDEGRHLILAELALHDGKGGYHLEVGRRHVSRAGRYGDLRDLEFGGELIDVAEGKPYLLQRFIDQRRGDRRGEAPAPTECFPRASRPP